KVCKLPWAAHFPRDGELWKEQLKAHLIDSSARASLGVHPTQLYESIGYLGIFGLVYFVLRTRRRAYGELFAWVVGLYCLVRFPVEFLRDDPRGGWAGLSTSQIISIPLFVFAVWLWWAARTGPARRVEGYRGQLHPTT